MVGKLVAPDYLLHHAVKDKFYAAFKKHKKNFMENNPEDSADYPRIINDKHFNRLS